jgi:antitoxin component of MazEF toxin-antitoxin module
MRYRFKYPNRRIMKVGPFSLAITLPFEFAKEHQLNKGDLVSIISEGKNLVLKFQKGDR